MSLNRTEQVLLEYVQSHPDERLFWEKKVQRVAASSRDAHQTAMSLDDELWRYYQERAQFVSGLREVANPESLKKISMRNLADYWIRLWTVPKHKKHSPETEGPRYGDL